MLNISVIYYFQKKKKNKKRDQTEIILRGYDKRLFCEMDTKQKTGLPGAIF